MDYIKSRKEYRKILGVDDEATQDEIKLAYRRLAKTCHPDMNRSDPEASKKFIEVKEAYEGLQKPDSTPVIYYNQYRSPFSRSEEFYQRSFSNLEEMLNSIFSSFNTNLKDPFFQHMGRRRKGLRRRMRKTVEPFERVEERFEELVRRMFYDFW